VSDEPGLRPAESATAEQERHSLPLDRFTAFSDGVFAIAITLLVLEISVPHGAVRVLPALREQWTEFLGYYISFAFIGGIWITHAGVTRFLKRGDAAAYALNLLLLLFVGLMPFTTDLMVTHLTGPDVKISVLLYGVNVLLGSLMLSVLIVYLAREPALLLNSIAESTLRRVSRQRWTAIGMNVLALVVALVAPQVAVGLYLVVTTLLLIIPLLGLRRHRRQPSAG